MNQRWAQRLASYRPAGEVIVPAEYDVSEIPDAVSTAFVIEHHYSASYPVARFDFGLFRHGRLVGVAVFSESMNPATITNVFPCERRHGVELGRFVLLDEVPGNGETWFLSRAFELLRAKEIRGVVSFSDPMPRRSADGRVVLPGHVGTIYQAFNGVYLGRSKRQVLQVLPDGTVFSNRAASKIRNQERNWRGPVEKLLRFGAEPFDQEDPAGWLRCQLARVARPMHHPGNHRYAWALDRRLRPTLESRRRAVNQPYPKHTDTEVA